MVSRQAVINEKRRSQYSIEKHYNSVNPEIYVDMNIKIMYSR